MSRNSYEDICRDHLVPPERLHIVPVGVDPELFAPMPGVERDPNRIISTASSDVAMKGQRYLLEALAKLTGGTASQVGSTPNRTLTVSQDSGAQMPYLRIAGRAVSASGGDVICRLYRCKVEALEGTFRDGEFWVTYCKGVAVSNGTIVYEFVQQETAAAL